MSHQHPTRDEFTEKMHSTFQIDEETEKRFTVYTFLDLMTWYKRSTREEQLQSYGITEADVQKYYDGWAKRRGK